MDPTSPTPPPALSPGRRSLTWALLAHPAVQAMGFLSKAAFAAFVGKVDFGEAMTASILVFGAQLCAVLGLDEAFVYARRPGRALWRALRRIHLVWGLVVAAATAGLAGLIGLSAEGSELPWLLLAFAPFVWIANQEVLPRALLRRERQFYPLFLVSLLQSGAMLVTTLVLAAWGAGAWAYVGGFYAQALAAVATTWTLSRGLRKALPEDHPEEDGARSVLRFGLPLTGTAIFNYLGERADSLLVRWHLGPAAVGVYELALVFARVVINWCVDLAERFLYPTLAHQGRERDLSPAWRGTLRLTVLVFLPMHVVMAAVSSPLVRSLFPPRWEEAVAVLPVLCLAEGLRCFDLIATTGLKAVGWGRQVLGLGVLRFVLLAAALAITLPRGLVAVALGVLGARLVGAAVSCLVAYRAIPLEPRKGADKLGIAAALVWAAMFAPAAWWLHARTGLSEPLLVLVLALFAPTSWAAARIFLDRRALLSEWSWLRLRLGNGREPDGDLA